MFLLNIIFIDFCLCSFKNLLPPFHAIVCLSIEYCICSYASIHGLTSCMSYDSLQMFENVAADCTSITDSFGDGTVRKNYMQDGEVVYQFDCNPGFSLKGSSVLSCLHGELNGSKPRCYETGQDFSFFTFFLSYFKFPSYLRQ